MILWLLACADPCGMTYGASRLACQFDKAVAAGSKGDLLAEADAIPDPTTHDAAILRWIDDHRKAVPLPELTELCTHLPPGDVQACQRRATAAHLSH